MSASNLRRFSSQPGAQCQGVSFIAHVSGECPKSMTKIGTRQELITHMDIEGFGKDHSNRSH